jgi:nucleotide-binding universal stress UspA family protein
MSAVVVGYVPKPEGRAALRRAAEEAKLRNVPLVVVNSVRAAKTIDPTTSLQAEEELAEVEGQLKSAGVEAQIRQLLPGSDVADDLIAAAQDSHADLMVIGLRRRSPIGKLILGSNAQRILLEAPCPVLAVKAEG